MKLSAGHARSLAALPADEAEEFAVLMVKHGYSVREAGGDGPRLADDVGEGETAT